MQPFQVVSSRERKFVGSHAMFTLPLFSVQAKAAALSLVSLLFPLAASATMLMLDFGPTVATGSSQTNSPYHSVNASFKDTYWNTIGLSNINTGLVYSDGTPAKGVSVTLGSSIQSSVIDFTETPANSLELGATINTGVFAGTSVGKDGIFTSSKPPCNNLVGIKVSGLPAGRYHVYVVGLNTSNAVSRQSPSAFFAFAAAGVTTFDTDGVTPSETTLFKPEALEQWIEGENFAQIAVEVKEAEELILIADGTGLEDRGFLNAVQIVTAAEPTKP